MVVDVVTRECRFACWHSRTALWIWKKRPCSEVYWCILGVGAEPRWSRLAASGSCHYTHQGSSFDMRSDWWWWWWFTAVCRHFSSLSMACEHQLQTINERSPVLKWYGWSTAGTECSDALPNSLLTRLEMVCRSMMSLIMSMEGCLPSAPFAHAPEHLSPSPSHPQYLPIAAVRTAVSRALCRDRALESSWCGCHAAALREGRGHAYRAGRIDPYNQTFIQVEKHSKGRQREGHMQILVWYSWYSKMKL